MDLLIELILNAVLTVLYAAFCFVLSRQFLLQFGRLPFQNPPNQFPRLNFVPRRLRHLEWMRGSCSGGLLYGYEVTIPWPYRVDFAFPGWRIRRPWCWFAGLLNQCNEFFLTVYSFHPLTAQLKLVVHMVPIRVPRGHLLWLGLPRKDIFLTRELSMVRDHGLFFLYPVIQVADTFVLIFIDAATGRTTQTFGSLPGIVTGVLPAGINAFRSYSIQHIGHNHLILQRFEWNVPINGITTSTFFRVGISGSTLTFAATRNVVSGHHRILRHVFWHRDTVWTLSAEPDGRGRLERSDPNGNWQAFPVEGDPLVGTNNHYYASTETMSDGLFLLDTVRDNLYAIINRSGLPRHDYEATVWRMNLEERVWQRVMYPVPGIVFSAEIIDSKILHLRTTRQVCRRCGRVEIVSSVHVHRSYPSVLRSEYFNLNLGVPSLATLCLQRLQKMFFDNPPDRKQVLCLDTVDNRVSPSELDNRSRETFADWFEHEVIPWLDLLRFALQVYLLLWHPTDVVLVLAAYILSFPWRSDLEREDLDRESLESFALTIHVIRALQAVWLDPTPWISLQVYKKLLWLGYTVVFLYMQGSTA